ncbi:MAG: hypothetical protein FJ028_08070 [Chloroflexi bacterium]|nr:hypothetical protein [Chloroflexota bacterium]
MRDGSAQTSVLHFRRAGRELPGAPSRHRPLRRLRRLHTLAEELDPEVLQETVSKIFEDLAEEALGYDGTIEKFIGDAIFVVFGAPVAHEDDPQRALRCALGMQRGFADHAARVKRDRAVELGLRIGIHTGLVIAGQVRSVAEYGVMGDTVNTAARLEAAAAPGEIYVTDETFRLTQREFAFREVGPIQLRGKERPIMAYALSGERGDDRLRIDVSAPLVGRWMELSRLDLAFQSARLGRGEVVVITGEPGVGKSRLVSEFLGLAAAEGDGASAADAPRVMRWTFSRVNQRSYAGFIEPLLVELGLEPTAQDAGVGLEAKLKELGFAEPAPGRISPMLATFLHLRGAAEVLEESEEQQRSMYIAVFDVLAALARTRPVLYILEDLHYADSASLDLLQFVAARASGIPLLFLLAHRLGSGSPELRVTRANFSQLVLQPLSDEEAARIVETTVPMPEELRDRIVARAGGNPFFIEESIRSLIDSGLVEKDEATGGWLLARVPAGLLVPATLHASSRRASTGSRRWPRRRSSSRPSSACASATACCAPPGATAWPTRWTSSLPPTSSSRPPPPRAARAATGSSTPSRRRSRTTPSSSGAGPTCTGGSPPRWRRSSASSCATSTRRSPTTTSWARSRRRPPTTPGARRSGRSPSTRTSRSSASPSRRSSSSTSRATSSARSRRSTCSPAAAATGERTTPR